MRFLLVALLCALSYAQTALQEVEGAEGDDEPLGAETSSQHPAIDESCRNKDAAKSNPSNYVKVIFLNQGGMDKSFSSDVFKCEYLQKLKKQTADPEPPTLCPFFSCKQAGKNFKDVREPYFCFYAFEETAMVDLDKTYYPEQDQRRKYNPEKPPKKHDGRVMVAKQDMQLCNAWEESATQCITDTSGLNAFLKIHFAKEGYITYYDPCEPRIHYTKGALKAGRGGELSVTLKTADDWKAITVAEVEVPGAAPGAAKVPAITEIIPLETKGGKTKPTTPQKAFLRQGCTLSTSDFAIYTKGKEASSPPKETLTFNCKPLEFQYITQCMNTAKLHTMVVFSVESINLQPGDRTTRAGDKTISNYLEIHYGKNAMFKVFRNKYPQVRDNYKCKQLSCFSTDKCGTLVGIRNAVLGEDGILGKYPFWNWEYGQLFRGSIFSQVESYKSCVWGSLFIRKHCGASYRSTYNSASHFVNAFGKAAGKFFAPSIEAIGIAQGQIKIPGQCLANEQFACRAEGTTQNSYAITTKLHAYHAKKVRKAGATLDSWQAPRGIAKVTLQRNGAAYQDWMSRISLCSTGELKYVRENNPGEGIRNMWAKGSIMPQTDIKTTFRFKLRTDPFKKNCIYTFNIAECKPYEDFMIPAADYRLKNLTVCTVQEAEEQSFGLARCGQEDVRPPGRRLFFDFPYHILKLGCEADGSIPVAKQKDCEIALDCGASKVNPTNSLTFEKIKCNVRSIITPECNDDAYVSTEFSIHPAKSESLICGEQMADVAVALTDETSGLDRISLPLDVEQKTTLPSHFMPTMVIVMVSILILGCLISSRKSSPSDYIFLEAENEI